MVLAVALVVGLLASPSAADPGEIRPTFAGDGTLDLAAAQRVLETDGQGRIVAASVPYGSDASTLTLQRFTGDGTPDPAFSGDGELALTYAGQAAGSPELFSLDGGLLVGLRTGSGLHVWSVDEAGVLDAGYGDGGLALVPPLDASAAAATLPGAVPVGDGLAVVWTEGQASQITVLGPTGQPRASFGGDGTVDAPAVIGPVLARPSGGLVVRSSNGLVAVAPDGTLGAPVNVPVEAGESHGDLAVDAQDRVLMATSTTQGGTVLRRLTSSFAVDPSYGTGGATDLAGTGASFEEVAGRRFVVTGAAGEAAPTHNGYRGRVWIHALDADGALDSAWGSSGVATIDEVLRQGAYVYDYSRPVATLAPAPAGGIAVGVRHSWREHSVFGMPVEIGANRLYQLAADGGAVATFDPPVSPAIRDGGDGGATVLTRHGTSAPDGGDRFVRVELQQPEPLGATATPVVVSVDGATFTLTWTPASGSPTSYRVSAWEPGASTSAAAVDVEASELSTTITVPKTGRPYRFDVQASNGPVTGPRSGATGYTLAPFATAGGFVGQLHQDVPTWRPGATQRRQAAIAVGQTGAVGDLLLEVANDPGLRQQVDPVVRIYTAYFGRLPDSGGLRYWVGKRRAGMTVARISAQFAASSEFQRTYGKLSDRAFTTLVYENVLGRAPDQAGLDYWTGRLASKRISRGQLMANFSESGEHVRKLARRAFAVRSALAFLGRAAKASEVAPWEGSSSTELDLLTAIIESPEYAQRVG